MLENTDKAVADLLQKLPSIIEGASTQLPDIAKELLIYGDFDAQLGIGIGIVIALVAILCGFKWLLRDEEVSGFVGLVLFAFSLAFIGCGIGQLYKVKNTPKVYLLEKVTDYVKPNK